MPLASTLFGVVCPLGFRAIMRRDNWPGLVLSLLAATMALIVARVAPAVSPLLVAIVLGILATNIRPLPDRLSPGLAVASKRLPRMGIVLLGLQLVLADIAALGVRMVVAVALIVAFGFAGTLMAGRALGVPPMQRLLVAAGFSICGAAAVAAVDGVVEADEEDVASAIALVVLFGTAMIALGPALTGLLDLSTRRQGLVIGGAVHEVAQVVAAGGIIGHAALAAAVTVKLARVAMLAPMIMVIGARRRHRLAAAATTSNPPLVPLFVAGFLAAAGAHRRSARRWRDLGRADAADRSPCRGDVRPRHRRQGLGAAQARRAAACSRRPVDSLALRSRRGSGRHHHLTSGQDLNRGRNPLSPRAIGAVRHAAGAAPPRRRAHRRAGRGPGRANGSAPSPR